MKNSTVQRVALAQNGDKYKAKVTEIVEGLDKSIEVMINFLDSNHQQVEMKNARSSSVSHIDQYKSESVELYDKNRTK